MKERKKGGREEASDQSRRTGTGGQAGRKERMRRKEQKHTWHQHLKNDLQQEIC